MTNEKGAKTFLCCNVSGQMWMHSTNSPGEMQKPHFWRINLLETVVNGQCFGNRYLLKADGSGCRLDASKESEFYQFVVILSNNGAICEFGRIWSTQRYNFSLLLWTGTLSHQNWSETKYLSEKQEKYPGYASKNYFWNLPISVSNVIARSNRKQQKQRKQQFSSGFRLIRCMECRLVNEHFYCVWTFSFAKMLISRDIFISGMNFCSSVANSVPNHFLMAAGFKGKQFSSAFFIVDVFTEFVITCEQAI